MSLRVIALVIAILSGLGALYFSQFRVKPKIAELTSERDTARTESETARGEERKAKGEATKARADLDSARKELDDKTTKLATAEKGLRDQMARASQYKNDLDKTTVERNQAQEELSIWKATGLSYDEVRKLKSEFARVSEERGVIAEENKLFARNIKVLQGRIAKYEGTDKDPEMPAGLKGKVVAVDPKFNFVVLDIGGNQGVVERGKLLVRREDKWVGAVRISRVEPNQSVANLIMDMTQAEIMEGDVVLY